MRTPSTCLIEPPRLTGTPTDTTHRPLAGSLKTVDTAGSPVCSTCCTHPGFATVRRFAGVDLGVGQHAERRIDEPETLPAPVQREHACGGVRKRAGSGSSSGSSFGKDMQSGNRAVDLLIDRDRHRARLLDVLPIDQDLLLRPGGPDQTCGKEPEGDRGRQHEQRKDRAQAKSGARHALLSCGIHRSASHVARRTLHVARST